jgi:hypothetical protein
MVQMNHINLMTPAAPGALQCALAVCVLANLKQAETIRSTEIRGTPALRTKVSGSPRSSRPYRLRIGRVSSKDLPGGVRSVGFSWST